MKTNLIRIGLITAIVVSLLAAVSLAVPFLNSAKADAVSSVNTVQVMAFGNVTTTQYSSALVQSYGTGDCYARHTEAITPAVAQTVTFALYHGPDTAHTVSLLSFAAQTTDTIAFTRTLIYGNYMSASVTLGTSSRPITGSIVCVLKNVQQ